MPDIDTVLERLAEDAAFRTLLVRDPKAALDGYELSGDDLQLLVQRVRTDQEGLDPAGQRASKAGFFALFSRLADNGARGAPDGRA